MAETRYKIILYWDKRDRIFVAEIPELPGCIAHGETRLAAIESAEQAIEAWVSSARADNQPIPNAPCIGVEN